MDIGSVLTTWNILVTGQCLRAGNNIAAKLQTDGNFVIYNGENVVWSTHTYNTGVAPWRLNVQTDGNIVLYDGNNNPTWKAFPSPPNTGAPFINYRLVLQNDGELILEGPPAGAAIWRSNAKAT